MVPLDVTITGDSDAVTILIVFVLICLAIILLVEVIKAIKSL